MKFRLMIGILLIVGLGSVGQAAVVGRSLPYEHNGTTLEGYLAYDDAIKGKRPAILVVHEWWGLNAYARSRAEQLAKMGYVAFALDMYGKGKVTEHPQQAGQWSKQVTANIDRWRQRAMAGLAVLKNQPQTDPDRMAAIGYCFGGGTVQQLAYAGANLRAVVSFHGALQMPGNVSADKVHASILICHGAADPLVGRAAIAGYLEAMDKAGLDYQFIAYGGAKHSFTNPGADKRNIGALGYNPKADRRSWAHMKQFFDAVMAPM